MSGRTNDKTHYSFCGEIQDQVRKLIASSSNVLIYDECVDLYGGVLEEELDRHEGEGLDLNDTSLLKPREAKSLLDEYVIGQEDMKKVLSVVVYNHYKRAASKKDMNVDVQKSSIPILSPTGSDKTYLTQTLAKVLNVPFTIADATASTKADYMDEDVENTLLELIQAADYDISKTGYGIIYIDEIDKVTKKSENISVTRDIPGGGVQQALLKILEGTVTSVPPQDGRKHPHQELLQTDITSTLFVRDEAPDDLEETVGNHLNASSIEFNSDVPDGNDMDTDGLLKEVLPQDLTRLGLTPEFIGYVSVTISLDMLTGKVLIRILSKPKNTLTKQYQRLFELDNVKLGFAQDTLLGIAELAGERKTGVRGLRSIMGSVMMDLMYEMPSGSNIGICTITKELVDGGGEPKTVYHGTTVPHKAITQRLKKSSPPGIAQSSIKN